jgi:hypothetical protein
MPLRQYGFGIHGVDYATAPINLAYGMLADSSNCVVDDSGFVKGRGGLTYLNTTPLASRVTSLFEFRSGTTRYQLASYATKIALYNSGTGAFDDEITGLTTGKMLQWVNFQNKAICVNEGTEAPQYFTDASTHGALAGSPPTGRTIAEWSNRLWLGGDATNVALLSGSGLNDPTDWATTGATGKVQIYVGDPKDPITGVFPFFDMLLVGKKNALYKVVGDIPTDATDLNCVPLYSKDSDSTGFTSPWAITQVGNDLIYLDGFDIKRLSGIQEYGDVETVSIIPQFREYLAATVSEDYIKYAQFFHYKQKQQIWCTIPKTATTHLVFCLDYKFYPITKRYAVFPMANMETTCITGIENGSVTDMYVTDESGYAHLYSEAVESDNGTAISKYFTEMFSGNDMEQGMVYGHEKRKQFLKSETYIKKTQTLLSMTPYYALDLMDSAQVRTSGNYTALTAETVSGWSGTGVKKKKLRFFGLSGNTLALKWTHATGSQNFIMFPSELHFEWKANINIV